MLVQHRIVVSADIVFSQMVLFVTCKGTIKSELKDTGK
jgi:hypothetical protein